MDATQKRRMWKVAIAHFCLSVYVLMFFQKYAVIAYSFGGEPILETQSRIAWLEAWRNFWIAAVSFLQPHLSLLGEFSTSFHITIPKWPTLPLCFLSIPAWSICFGWLYVKFTNWLNHFPVLGKKVF